MAQRLKRWESPRKAGRNSKGKGGTARQRQRKKQFKLLKKRLEKSSNGNNQNSENDFKEKGRDLSLPPFFACMRFSGLYPCRFFYRRRDYRISFYSALCFVLGRAGG